MQAKEWKERCANRIEKGLNLPAGHCKELAVSLYDGLAEDHTPEEAADGELVYWAEE